MPRQLMASWIVSEKAGAVQLAALIALFKFSVKNLVSLSKGIKSRRSYRSTCPAPGISENACVHTDDLALEADLLH
jgi:hypothetical protein